MEQQCLEIKKGNSKQVQELINSFSKLNKIISDDDYYRASNFFDNIIENYELSDEQWEWLYELHLKILAYEDTENFEKEYTSTKSAIKEKKEWKK